MSKFYRHIQRNAFWIITGLELIAVAVYFLFIGKLDPDLPPYLYMLGDGGFQLFFYTGGVLSIVVGIWDFWYFGVEILQRAWLAMSFIALSVAVLVSGFDNNILRLDAILLIFVVIRIFIMCFKTPLRKE